MYIYVNIHSILQQKNHGISWMYVHVQIIKLNYQQTVLKFKNTNLVIKIKCDFFVNLNLCRWNIFIYINIIRLNFFTYLNGYE